MFSQLKNRKLIGGLGLLIVFYLLTRLVNLTVMPVFVDEAIYTRWSQVILNDHSQFFIPLSDGKQPLYMWLGAISLALISDPLMATRVVSVLAGLIGLLGVWWLTKELFNKQTAWLSAIVYLVCPFLVFYNRLAVADGLLTTFFIYITLASVWLIRKPNLKNALILSLVLGGGLLTKSTAAIAIFFLPLALLCWPSKQKFNWTRILQVTVLSGGAVIVGLVLYSLLRLSPLYYLIGQRTGDFIFTPKEVLTHPLDPFIGRISDVTGWLVEYLTWPIFGLVVLSLVFLLLKKWRLGIFLGGWLIGPLVIEMEIAKGFTPRYFIFIAPMAVILAGVVLNWLLKNWAIWRIGLVLLILIPALSFDYLLLTDPPKAPIPTKEKTGYLEEWSAGYGIYEISQYLKDVAKAGQPITVGTEGIQGYGTLPDGLEIYLRDVKNVSVVGMGQRAAIYNVPPDLISDSRIHPAYLVVNQSRMIDKDNPNLKLITFYPKGNGGDPLLFYQVMALSK